jgi:hypothetical protein
MFWVWNFQNFHSNLPNSTFFSAISVYLLPKNTVAVFPVQSGFFPIPTAGSHSLLFHSSVFAGRESLPDSGCYLCMRSHMHMGGEHDAVNLEAPRYASMCNLKPAKDWGLSCMPASVYACERPWNAVTIVKPKFDCNFTHDFRTPVSEELVWASVLHGTQVGGWDVSSGML